MISARFSVLAVPLCWLTALAIVPRPLPAQQAPQPVVYASYYECDPLALQRVDSLMSAFWGPIAERHMAAGHATAWGWLGHHTGGTWNRAFYVVSPDVNDALDAIGGVNTDARAADAALVRETMAACPVHEDYIWQRVAGSQPSEAFATSRPQAGLSIYYECDPAREQRADAVFTASLAPAFDRMVASGDMNSWGWMQHLVGGKYRRLLVTDGPDAKTLLGAIGGIVQELRVQQPNAFREFSEICGSHQDNVWRILTTKP